MTILFVNSIAAETWGGREEWTGQVGVGLVNRGHRVIAAGRRNSRFLSTLDEQFPEIETWPLPISGDFDPILITRLKSRIRAEQVDLIVANFNKDLRLGGLAARWDGGPRVVWRVGVDITSDKMIHRLLTPRLIDAIVVPSESLKRQMTQRPYLDADSIVVIPNGLPDQPISVGSEIRDAVRQRLGIPDDALVALSVSRLVEEKGHSTYLGALPTVLKAVPNLNVVIVGDGPLEETIRARVQELEIADSVELVGYQKMTSEFMAAADLFVHPSLAESFGIAVLEAMRAGLPVVATTAGGLPEVVGESGRLVPPDDSEALANAIISVATSAETRRGLGKLGRQRFENHFTATRMVDRLERLFLQLHSSEVTRGRA